MTGKYELLLPPRNSRMSAYGVHADDAQAVFCVPELPDGIISSALARRRAERQARTWKARTEAMRSAKDFFDAELAAMESYIRSREAAYRLQTLPERLDAERQLAHTRRLTEQAEATARLVDANQVLQAQQELGSSIARTKKNCELLDVQMAAAEREAILEEHLREHETNALSARLPAPAGGDVDELYRLRASLHAQGIDASAVDAVIQQRGATR